MLGAIIGDIIGSRFEFDNIHTKNFKLFTDNCFPTDDSVLTIATAKALLNSNSKSDLKELFIQNYKEQGRKYPNSGYGGRFMEWLFSNESKPYHSIGNGSAMRVSPCGWAAQSLEEAGCLGRISASVTHNSIQGFKGADLISKCIFLAKTKHSKKEILEKVKEYYKNDFLNNFNLDNIRQDYLFDVTCNGSVPHALEAFLEGNDYEDVIRNAISIGGDSDTIAAIAGGIAEAYYGIPNKIKQQGLKYLDKEQKDILKDFYKKYN